MCWIKSIQNLLVPFGGRTMGMMKKCPSNFAGLFGGKTSGMKAEACAYEPLQHDFQPKLPPPK